MVTPMAQPGVSYKPTSVKFAGFETSTWLKNSTFSRGCLVDHSQVLDKVVADALLYVDAAFQPWHMALVR